MTIHIPEWLLWAVGIVIGVPAIICVIGLAVFGYVAAKALAGWRLR